MNKKLMWHLILSALCLFPILFSGCKTKDKPTKHVILISMDTTRADHLSCYGFDKKTTPNIDTFAKDSVLFEQCISPIPLTLPSHSSMLTGTNPVYHGVHNNDQYTLDKANTTLAERFKEKGYATGAVVSTFVLDRQFGMSQGFDTYDDTFRNPLVGPDEAERRGSETSQVAIEWLEKHQDEDFFLFLHYYDPHGAYQPPEPYATQFANDLYAGEIAYTDYCIQQVLDKLKALKIYDDALIIIVGDHGEGRGEHDEDSHGYYIYQSCIHVPLLVRFPGGQHENKRIEQTVGLVDLAPTICRWTELDPLSEYIGQDLTGYVEKNDIDERLLYSESLLPTKYGCSSLLSLTGDRWKYIQSSEPELYDLKNDPGELDNLIEPEAKRARLLQDELKLLIAEQVRETGSRSDQELDDESRKKLESLGYVAGGAVDEDFEFDTSKVPPREWIRVYEMSGECKTYLKFGLYPEAEKTVRRMIADKPFYVLNYYFLADAQQNQGKYTEAIATAREFLRRAEEKMQGLSEDQTMKPVDQFIPDIYMILGRCYFEMQQYDKAIEEYQHGLETADDEKAGKLLNNIGNVYMVQGQFDRALEKYVETIKLFSDFPQAHLNMGVIYAQRKEYENAQRAYAKAYQLDPELEEAKQRSEKMKQLMDAKTQIKKTITQYTTQLEKEPNSLDLLLRLGEQYLFLDESEKAIEYWQRALAIEPDNPDLLNNLAFIFAEKKKTQAHDLDKALQYAEKACRLTKHQNPNYLDTLALVHASRGDFDKAVAIAQEALVIAVSENNTELARSIQKSIQQYKNGSLP